LGAFCELILIFANIGTAVVLFPILKRQSEGLALGYVAARLVECTFIAIGIVSYLAVVSLRQKGGGADAGSLVAVGKSLVAVRNWTFVLGPGFVAGIGNGLILGYLMYQSRLVPRGMAVLGLIGGPLICLSGIAVVMNIIGRGSAAQGIATVPEFLWELSLGIYLAVKGFASSPISQARNSHPVAGPPKPAVAHPRSSPPVWTITARYRTDGPSRAQSMSGRRPRPRAKAVSGPGLLVRCRPNQHSILDESRILLRPNPE
jgi:hypothetical protein